MKLKHTTKFPVSVIIPMRNSETTILLTLESLLKQTYPIKEIIIVDNVSTDSSISIVKKYIAKNKKIPIRLLLNKENKGVGGSYNRGVKKAASDYVVLMHSDSKLDSENELSKLTAPFYKDKEVVATFSYNILPMKVWRTYNFWQKTLLVRALNYNKPGLNGKFDCVKKNVFKKIGGFNVEQYGHHIMVGADDSDLHMRLLKEGKTVATRAKVIHLHYLGKDYSIGDFFENRKLLANSYGRLLRLENIRLGFGGLKFLVKPALLILLFLPFLYPLNMVIFLSFIFWYYSRMYFSSETRLDPKIILLPFVTVILTILEVFWMIKAFLFLNKSNV